MKSLHKKLKRRIRRRFYNKKWYRDLYHRLPLKNKTVVFFAFHGKGYMDSPRAIFEAMRDDPYFKDWNFIWAISKANRKGLTIPGARIVDYGSREFHDTMSRAHYWVVNCRLNARQEKRPGQIYVQTWHGTPLKRLGADVPYRLGKVFNENKLTHEQMIHTYETDSPRYDYFLSPRPYTDGTFQTPSS